MSVVTVSIPVNLKPFMVPNYVIVDEPPKLKQEGVQLNKCIPIEELPQDALDALANNWLQQLYGNAKKSNPFTMGIKRGA